VSGVADASGNVAPAFSSSFTTGTASVSTRPSVVSVNPGNGATNVAVNSAVVLTFSAPVDATTVNNGSVQVWINAGNSPLVVGTYSVNGAVVTFTPSQPLEVNSSYTVRANTNAVVDLAGNGVNFFQSSFSTAAGVDTTAPVVVAVNPGNGAVGIGLNSAVVLTFSKPLNSGTVNGSTFELLANGVQLQPSVSISSDDTTVVLGGITLPGSSEVTVVATRDVQDLVGNHLADFSSTFTTVDAFDTGHASVVSQRPGNGATGVGVNSTVVLYVNEAMNVGTIAGAVHVVQNGVVVSGTVQVRDSGETIEFVPSAPWQFNAVVEVHLDGTALDVDGATLNGYQGSFTTMKNPQTTAPALVSVVPSGGAGIPTNAVVQIQYSEPLDATTVNASAAELFVNGGPQVAGTVQLVGGGTVLQITPNAALAANTNYFCCSVS
jgi:large repetitive protein